MSSTRETPNPLASRESHLLTFARVAFGAALIVTVVALFFTVSGCSLAIGGNDFVENACIQNTDCPGATCDLNSGMCVSRPVRDDLRIGLSVTPAFDSSGNSPEPFNNAPILFNQRTELDIQLPETTRLIGTLRAPMIEGAVPAELTFVRADTVVGAEPITVDVATTLTPQIGNDGLEFDFEAGLTAGTQYRVRVRPTGDAAKILPPWDAGVVETPAISGVFRESLNFPVSSFRVVEGTIKRRVGEDGVLVGVGGLQIKAIERDTGRVVSSTAVSSSSDPEAPNDEVDEGAFSLALPRGVDFVLSVKDVRESGRGRIVPTTQIAPEHLIADADGRIDVLVSSLARVRYSGFVESMSGEGGRVEAAHLIFRSLEIVDEATGIEGALQRSVTTDSEGAFEVNLVPGSYEVVVEPSTDLPVGVTASTIRIAMPAEGDQIMGQLFELPARARLGGMVLTSDQRVMPGATVEAIALGVRPDEMSSRAARYNRSSTAVTDETGQFDLRLDVGAYDIRIRPPAMSGFPWIVERRVIIGSPDTPVTRTFEISPPIPLDGVVLNADGEPVAGAELIARGLVENESGELESVLVGRGQSDDMGQYQILLPASY